MNLMLWLKVITHRMNNFLKYLIEDPACLYIYTQDLSIYGLDNSLDKYTVIVDTKWELSGDWTDLSIKEFVEYNSIIYDNCEFQIYTITKWFDKVLNGDILCWICACLNKKFVIKEYVKLIMKTDPLKLRKEIDAKLDPCFMRAQYLIDNGSIEKGVQQLWEIIRDIKFVNQIYESHKIVNFKEANPDWIKLNSTKNPNEIIKIWIDLSVEPLKLLHLRTDDSVKAEKIKRVLQNE